MNPKAVIGRFYKAVLSSARPRARHAQAIDDKWAVLDQTSNYMLLSEHIEIGWLGFDLEGKDDDTYQLGLHLATIDGRYTESHHFVFGDPHPHGQPPLFTPDGLSIRLDGPEQVNDVMSQFLPYCFTRFRYLLMIGHDSHSDTFNLWNYAKWPVPDYPNLRVLDVQKTFKLMGIADKEATARFSLKGIYNHFCPITDEQAQEMHFHNGLNDAKYTVDVAGFEGDYLLGLRGQKRPEYAKPPLPGKPFVYNGGRLVNLRLETPIPGTAGAAGAAATDSDQAEGGTPKRKQSSKPPKRPSKADVAGFVVRLYKIASDIGKSGLKKKAEKLREHADKLRNYDYEEDEENEEDDIEGDYELYQVYEAEADPPSKKRKAA